MTNHTDIIPMRASYNKAASALKKILKNERLVDELVNTQTIEFSKLRSDFPNMNRNQAIKISILNAAILLESEKYTPTLSFIQVAFKKRSPKYDWLSDRSSYIFELKNSGASLREIKAAVFYRFHKKISHTLISQFINNSKANHEC